MTKLSNINAFAERVILALKNVSARKIVEKKAFDFAAREYSTEKCSAEYRKIITDLIGNN